jgi:carbamoyl-phosphate synthase large subunit
MDAAARAAPSVGGALRLFVRQPLTRSGPEHRDIVQAVVDLARTPGVAPGPVDLLPYRHAHHAGTFKDAFTQETGTPFTPAAFRAWRLAMLDSADAMLVVRTELSESGAYEIAYNVHAGPAVPVFFAVHTSCPITTTLLRDLEPLVDAHYAQFAEPAELTGPLRDFLAKCPRHTPLAEGIPR